MRFIILHTYFTLQQQQSGELILEVKKRKKKKEKENGNVGFSSILGRTIFHLVRDCSRIQNMKIQFLH